ncbi:unnamed protein product [Didymodactylos carnosus]|uniref:Uncharacterized protein n=1 Tax=Didymodactylos carnosus TaxID=1234261 RepID=A0A8S2G930_9BILA|nr:unnamed protein product [Didymodactylos carnosus]CAF4512602.1 unnamed protein product [Didymodactylos carnosus]
MEQGMNSENPNVAYWFEHELRQYPIKDFDMEALEKNKDKLILAVGRESRGTLPYFPNTILAEKFGQKTLELPGGHLGYASHAADFAKELIDSLKERGKL